MMDRIFPMGFLQVGQMLEHLPMQSLQMRWPFSHWYIPTLKGMERTFFKTL